MYLVFDTETTGLPQEYDAPISDVQNWPRVVQLAWATFDKNGLRGLERSTLIRPDGFRIPKEAEQIHGISTRVAKLKGIPIAEAIRGFREQIALASVVVSHNFKFDSGVIGAEFYRLGIRRPFHRKVSVCTMEASTDYCALPGWRGFKWPRLGELHFKLFKKELKKAHDAGADVATCSKCFFELKRLGIIRTPSKARLWFT